MLTVYLQPPSPFLPDNRAPVRNPNNNPSHHTSAELTFTLNNGQFSLPLLTFPLLLRVQINLLIALTETTIKVTHQKC